MTTCSEHNAPKQSCADSLQILQGRDGFKNWDVRIVELIEPFEIVSLVSFRIPEGPYC